MTAAHSSIAALLLCSATLLVVVDGCGFRYPAVVGRVAPGTLPQAFTDDEVAQHFNNQGVLKSADALRSMFSCVDARGPTPMLGTPGGTFNEFSMGLQVWEELRGVPLDYAEVSRLFRAFMSSRYISPSSQFFFHNAAANLENGLFAYLATKGIEASILPDTEPKEGAEFWYEGLSLPASNGCGHVRLQLAGQLDAENEPAYGKRAQAISTYLIKAFYKYWWPTPLNSKERKRVYNEILPGPLDGRSVTIVGATPTASYKGRRLLNTTSTDMAAADSADPVAIIAGASITPAAAVALSARSNGKPRQPVDRNNKCSTIWPLVIPNRAGSSAFCYHAAAVEQYRESVITVWFDQHDNASGNKFTRKQFNDALAALAGKQLTATLTYLAPANGVGITTATYQRTH